MPAASIPNTFSNTPAGTNVIDATQVNANYAALLAGVNNVDETQLVAALLQRLGLNNGAQVGRGKSIIGTIETRTNTAYGTMTTPDQVTGIVLPTDGLIFVTYSARWNEAVSGAGRAGLFLGSNQVLVQNTAGVSNVAEVNNSGNTGLDAPLTLGANGFSNLNSVVAMVSEAGTGTVIGGNASQGGTWSGGGACIVWANAGTYTVSIQFKATSGGVTVKNRRLLVWTLGF